MNIAPSPGVTLAGNLSNLFKSFLCNIPKTLAKYLSLFKGNWGPQLRIVEGIGSPRLVTDAQGITILSVGNRSDSFPEIKTQFSDYSPSSKTHAVYFLLSVYKMYQKVTAFDDAMTAMPMGLSGN